MTTWSWGSIPVPEERGVVLKVSEGACIVLTEDGRFHTVRDVNEAQVGDEISFSVEQIMPTVNAEDSREPKWRIPSLSRVASLAAAACLLLAVGLTLGPGFGRTDIPGLFLRKAPVAYVTVDINPSIELSLDKNEKVLKGRGLNNDGTRVLNNAKVDGLLLKQALSHISISAYKLGYIKIDAENQMLVTATAVHTLSDVKLAKDLENARTAALSTVAKKDSKVKLKVAAVTVPKKVWEEAKREQLSVGKYIVLDTAKENGIKISAEQVRTSSLRNIIKETKLDMNDVVQEFVQHDTEVARIMMARGLQAAKEVQPPDSVSVGIPVGTATGSTMVPRGINGTTKASGEPQHPGAEVPDDKATVTWKDNKQFTGLSSMSVTLRKPSGNTWITNYGKKQFKQSGLPRQGISSTITDLKVWTHNNVKKPSKQNVSQQPGKPAYVNNKKDTSIQNQNRKVFRWGQGYQSVPLSGGVKNPNPMGNNPSGNQSMPVDIPNKAADGLNSTVTSDDKQIVKEQSEASGGGSPQDQGAQMPTQSVTVTINEPTSQINHWIHSNSVIQQPDDKEKSSFGQ